MQLVYNCLLSLQYFGKLVTHSDNFPSPPPFKPHTQTQTKRKKPFTSKSIRVIVFSQPPTRGCVPFYVEIRFVFFTLLSSPGTTWRSSKTMGSSSITSLGSTVGRWSDSRTNSFDAKFFTITFFLFFYLRQNEHWRRKVCLEEKPESDSRWKFVG